MPAAVGAEFDFGWLINHVMSMSDAEIASELGLRHRNQSLLFTVWAPTLNRIIPPSPSLLEVHPGEVASSTYSADTIKSCSPSSSSSEDKTPEVSPLSSPDAKHVSPPAPASKHVSSPAPPSKHVSSPAPPSKHVSPPSPPSKHVSSPPPPSKHVSSPPPPSKHVSSPPPPPLPPSPSIHLPSVIGVKRFVDTKIKFCFNTSVQDQNEKIKKQRTQVVSKDTGAVTPSQDRPHRPQQVPSQMKEVDPVVSACISSVLSSEEPVEQQEKHEQWQKVTHTRRPCSSGSAGRGRGRGVDTSKIKPLIPGLVGGIGKTNLNWLQQPKPRGRGRGRGHLSQNSQSQTQQGSATGQTRPGVDSKAGSDGLPPAAEASAGGATKQIGNIHGKPQQISVITANRTRKKKKNTNIAFDNGLKFRL